ncbi:matrixin family metalloprotease [Lacticaseibacillus baoqingensis]|uniref:Matrixin family metalloprotease n=1 Tax=Lacticaseibacillus baoqingensis TaxID=2486013 RepID=A0ABW4E597_9LACO|nr:matrixin family metalloprotease [Lacticaseibacillus baoqingensis]
MRWLSRLLGLGIIIMGLWTWRDTILPQLPTPATPTTTSASQSSTSSSSAASASNTPATPTESIVSGMPLANTYAYHFDNGVPAREQALFKQAVAAYNHTGIVTLTAGAGGATQNMVTFGVYHKQMATNNGTFELGHGGPQIIRRYGLTTTTVNHGSAQLNLTYASELSLSVAMHELGHALGLDHSTAVTSVMYPVDQGVTTLSAADLAGLRAIYPAAQH